MLYIILPVHNRAETTSLFLDALQRQTFQDFLLVLVDDGCTDETVSVAREKIPSDRLIVLQGDGQLWWAGALDLRSEEHTSELQSLMRISYAVFCLKKKNITKGIEL